MIEEAIAALIKLGKEAAPSVFPAPGEPNGSYFKRDADGSLDLVVPDVKPRIHAASSLVTLSQFATRNADTYAAWVGRTGITVLLNDMERRETVHLQLNLSEPFAALVSLAANTKKYTQRDAVLLLRTVFADCQDLCPELLPFVRQVKFTTKTETANQIQHGKASTGRAIDQEVAGVSKVPERVVLRVPVYANEVRHIAEIRCEVDIDLTAETFRFIPFPADIELAYQNATAEAANKLHDLLKAAGAEAPYERIYFGTP